MLKEKVKAKCIRCGAEYERPKKSRATYCKVCSNLLKKPSRLNFGPMKIINCYDYQPTRKG
jgi:DNA-directed RNA polymerase subunit RPC12/RpoP